MDISILTPYTIAKIVTDLRNIFTPENTQARNNILNYLKAVLDKTIQAKLNKVGTTRSFILLVGDTESAVLSSLYLYCTQKIDQTECIEGYRKYLETQEKQRQELLNKARSLAHPDIKSLGLRHIPQGTIQTVDNRVSEYVKSLNNYTFENCVDVDHQSLIRILPGLFNKVILGRTVFLEGLQWFTSNNHTQTLIKTIRDAKLRIVPGISSLFITSTKESDTLPREILDEFRIIFLMDDLKPEPNNATNNPQCVSIPELIYDSEKQHLASPDGIETATLTVQESKIIGMFIQNNPINMIKILNRVFDCKYKNKCKINHYDRNRFDVAVSKLNNKCEEKFKIKQLVKSFRDSKYGLTVKVYPVQTLPVLPNTKIILPRPSESQ